MSSIREKLFNDIEKNIDEFIRKVSLTCGVEKSDLSEIWLGLNKPTKSKKNKTDEDNNGDGCPYFWSKGTKKGTRCGAKSKSDSPWCSQHKKYANKDHKTSNVLPSKKSSSVVLHKHKKTGKLWHRDSGLVIKSAQDRVVVGCIENDTFRPLVEDDVDTCKKYGFKYDLKKTKSSNNKPNDSEVDSDSDSDVKPKKTKSKNNKPNDSEDDSDSDSDSDVEVKKTKSKNTKPNDSEDDSESEVEVKKTKSKNSKLSTPKNDSKTIKLVADSDNGGKFWEITQHDNKNVVKYGAVGKNGRRSSKTFKTAKEAEKAVQKLVKEKQKKGYKIEGKKDLSEDDVSGDDVSDDEDLVMKGKTAHKALGVEESDSDSD